MSTWIKVRTNLVASPEVILMADKLLIQEEYVVGLLNSAWSMADSNASEEGYITCGTARMLDRCVRFEGFAEAMQSVGWLVIGDNFISFPNYTEHNGTTAKIRAQSQKRGAKKRTRNANVTQERDASVTKCATEKRREEKRREDKEVRGADAFEVPEILRVDSFLSKWGEYIQHRKEKRSALTKTSAGAALKKLAAWGPERAAAALDHSIANGWTGIFEPDGKASKQQAKARFAKGAKYVPTE